VLALSLASGPGRTVLCAEGAHVAVDEAGAPEAGVGCKVLPLATREGKVEAESLVEALGVLGSVHQAQPSCLSLSQPTELGSLYSLDDLAELAGIAHRAGLAVHVDGARLANAAAALGVGFSELARGVDLLSFGGMKNGVAFGEALVVLEPALAKAAPFLRKTRLQLASKMRYIAAQYEAYLSGGVWERNAKAANRAARRLEAALRGTPGLEIALPVSTNAVFARVPPAAARELRSEFFFYDWEGGLVRWMTSFDTADEDVDRFAAAARRCVGLARG
jgi:threonine aldolase